MNIACKTTLSCNLLQKSSVGIHAVFFTALTENSPSFLRKWREQTNRYSGFIQNVSHTSFGCPSVQPCQMRILFCIFRQSTLQRCIKSVNLDSIVSLTCQNNGFFLILRSSHLFSPSYFLFRDCKISM